MSLAIVGVFVSIPIVIVVGGLGLYFLFGGVAAFVTGVLSALGSVHPSESPLTLMAIAPAMAATGAVALAGVGGYFWLVATLIGTLGRR
jgi:hypothetical protein